MERIIGSANNQASAPDFSLLSLPEFRRLLGQEIKRSERYCEYLSLLIIDFSPLMRKRSLSPRGRVEVTMEMGKRIKGSIRETDSICPLGQGRLALMLTGTPKEGAEHLASTIREGLFPLLSSEVPESDGQIKAMVTSYPEAGNGKENLLKFINTYLLLG